MKKLKGLKRDSVNLELVLRTPRRCKLRFTVKYWQDKTVIENVHVNHKFCSRKDIPKARKYMVEGKDAFPEEAETNVYQTTWMVTEMTRRFWTRIRTVSRKERARKEKQNSFQEGGEEAKTFKD